MTVFYALVMMRSNMILADIDLNATIEGLVTTFSVVIGGLSGLAFFRAGLLWMFSDENPQRATQARAVFAAAIVGTIICLAALTLGHMVVSSPVQKPAGGV